MTQFVLTDDFKTFNLKNVHSNQLSSQKTVHSTENNRCIYRVATLSGGDKEIQRLSNQKKASRKNKNIT